MPPKRKLRLEVRETGSSSLPSDRSKPAPAQIPPDPQDLGRPMTDDEKVDEALLESMDASDPPATGGPTRVGSPMERRSEPVEETVRRQKAAE